MAMQIDSTGPFDPRDQPNYTNKRSEYHSCLKEYKKIRQLQLTLKSKVNHFEMMLKQFQKKHTAAQQVGTCLQKRLKHLIFKQKIMNKQIKLEKMLSHDIYSFWTNTDWSTRRMLYIMLYVYSDFSETPTYLQPPNNVEDSEYTLRDEIKQKNYYISQLAHEKQEPSSCDILNMCLEHEYDWQFIESLV